MRKFTVFIFLTFILSQSFSQQTLSPEQFLGYGLGKKFTVHQQLVNYFNAVAATNPTMVKLEKFGQTFEGRPLIVAYVGLPENIQRLEAIRQNNLRMAHQIKDGVAVDEHMPAIVWLSYNVHGNEPASSEAAMKTIYELVNPANTATKEWLKNTIVIIDPCLNPDGRDRYVNWYNSVVGKNSDPDPQAREHREPWPRGRTNHYNFDLNRDWAWQTQIESKQRIAKYNMWLPQVHVDFHEQGYNAPYYFAPAAEPFHEVITPWQREFQVTIGKNNAKYFDQNGWLFFTKERFDLFYPSYGDTYPMYKGGIGMTFEQGGISAGLAVRNSDEDTLTLTARLEHHFTTSMSTIEMASVNASRLVQEFRKFYDNAEKNPPGEFKYYVVKSDGNLNRIVQLDSLFARNGIQTHGSSGKVNGLNYFNGKMESINIEPGDLVIPASQPNAVLLKVLMERQSRISDSATYDITAWGLPFAYGLRTFGVNDKIEFSQASTNSKQVAETKTSDAYAYVAGWKNMNDVKFLASLIKAGIKPRYAEVPFEYNGKKYDRGSLVITKTANSQIGSKLGEQVEKAARDNNVSLERINSGFVDKGFDLGSDKVHLVKKLKVVLVTGESSSSSAAGEIWHFFEQQIDYPLTLINANDWYSADWNKVDVIIIPDGNYRFLNDKSSAEDLRKWIDRGGKLIVLENAMKQISNLDWGLKLKKDPSDTAAQDSKKNPYEALKKYEDREKASLTESVPGAVYKVDLDNTHPLAFGYPDYYFTMKMDANIYEYFNNTGWNIGVLKTDNSVSGFTGIKTKVKMKNGLLIGAQEIGRGSVVYFADDLIFRSFWENGKLMLANAVFFVGD
ncbi:MAG: zinc carboxypeptidase [Bacteroidetes bacterium]|nr:MAG: zinc carboxypeptidase [Bacteroidota bacterium]